MQEDESGSETLRCLEKALRLARRITGNEGGSLGLHPAVYFYGPSGRHSGPLFMGTVMLLGSRLANNDKGFFRKFTEVRKPLEGILIEYKDLIATLIQKHDSRRRHENYCDFLEALISRLSDNLEVTEPALVEMAGLSGRVVAGIVEQRSKGFSEDVKSQAFITTALKGAIICPICGGYVDVEKSVSYDHAVPRRDGGGGQWKTVSSRIRTAISRSNSDSRCRAVGLLCPGDFGFAERTACRFPARRDSSRAFCSASICCWSFFISTLSRWQPGHSDCGSPSPSMIPES